MELLKRIKGINKWIVENPDVKDPNMFEIMDCTVELGKLARSAGVGDLPGKYPQEGELLELYKAHSEMVNHRLSFEEVGNPNSLVYYEKPLYELFSEILMRSKIGEYHDLEGLAGQNKKELLCRLAGVGLYIEQQKRAVKNGEHIEKIYDNEAEFQRIKALYEDYMLKPQQAYEQIKNMFESIEKEYNLSTGKI